MKDKNLAKLNSGLKETPIAVVGLAGVFAESHNLKEYWDNILNKIDCIIDVPASRWSIEDYYSPDASIPDKTYCKRGGFIPDLEFNPMEFGLPPNILEITDIAQLLTLVVAKDVIQDAGIGDGSGYDRQKVGITLGLGGGQKLLVPLVTRLQTPVLERVLKSCGLNEQDTTHIVEKFKKAYVGWEENSFPGMLGNVVAGRVANRFDLGGINCVLDAACAGSLAAIKMAVSELLEFRSETMLTGGICCDNSITMYMSFSKTPAFTTNETTQPFDINSKGMMVGEGLGMIALKRLADAERDNNKIYAVIKGIGSSSDGKFKSIYAPRPAGQTKAYRQAYEDAGFPAETVGLIEAHGTGTGAGDLAEFTGLAEFFAEDSDLKQHIALGSVKSQIGHTKAAAGTAGFIKAALALHHKVLPATINVSKPNPKFNVDSTPFYINTETRPWLPRPDGIPRRAGVSAFGFGGTNFHFVLEEHQPKAQGQYRLQTVAEPCLLSAANSNLLLQECKKQLEALKSDQAVNAHYLLRKGNGLRAIPQDHARLGFVSKSLDETITHLDTAIKTLEAKPTAGDWTLPKGVFFRAKGLETKGKVVSLFSGQGSQYLSMGSELAINFPPMMETLQKMDALFAADSLVPLSAYLYPKPVFSKEDAAELENALQLTQHAQPAIGAMSVGMFKVLQNGGFKTDFTAGHSFGELTALWAGGVISEDDYYKLAKARGKAMAAPDDPNFDAGTMVACVGEVDKILAEIKGFEGVSAANYNSLNQVVIAGATAQVQKAQQHLKDKGFKAVSLPVSAAFHTALVGHAQKPFAQIVQQVTFNKPKVPVFANGTGKAHPESPAAIQKALQNHILESVYFKDEIENIHQAGGRIFVEFGPKNVLTKLVENILKDKEFTAIAVNANPKKDSDTQLREAAVQLAVTGLVLENLDPYEVTREDPTTKKKTALSVMLNGGLYTSEKTLKIFEDALKDGYQVQGCAAAVAAPAPQTTSRPALAAPAAKTIEPTSIESAQAVATVQVAGQQLVESIEHSIDKFYQNQTETLAVHEKYLESPKLYTETFKTLMEQQSALIQQGRELPASIERSMQQFHEHQGETLRVHEHYLAGQASATQELLAEMKAQYGGLSGAAVSVRPAPVVERVPAAAVVNSSAVKAERKSAFAAKSPASAPASVAAVKAEAPVPMKPAPKPVTKPVPAAAAIAVATGIDFRRINEVMLKIVGEKTGYPVEMLELDMDMEADLGIDSIKRVEILGTVQDEIPELPELNADDLAELRTLRQIVEYMQSKVPSLEKREPGAATQADIAVAKISHATGIDLKKVRETMLKVVGDKTGYPVEMLELDMDMEADLGIDSIKRVEILGTVQDQLPELPELNADDLAELRTLRQIVDYMQSKAPAGGAPVSPGAATEIAVAAIQMSAATGIDVSKIQGVMLRVVGDKTGYPVEMLELEMDMEADLGIDSIKRVEILGTVQDELPELPELNADDLAELRTLGQIVDYMKSRAPAGVKPVVTQVEVAATHLSAATGVDLQKIKSVMLKVVGDKTGYPVEMLELEMDMEADLGIDSIKRVEILGTVQDELPELPELNADDLAELRTLGQIVEYMEKQSPRAGNVEIAPGVATPSDVVAVDFAAATGINVEKIKTVMLQVVGDKTGYPVEMLELEMDMEADLGIDSIKRVEILGTVQDELPELPELNADDLAELRTLGQIVDYMKSRVPSAVVSAAVVGSVRAAVAQATTVKAVPVAVAPAQVSSGIDIHKINAVMLKVVSDKTGYPVEMLELEMDMEADLGIDSIKRVEILGTVQDELEELPELNADELAELRTLGEVVNYMRSKVPGTAPAATQADVVAAEISQAMGIDLDKVKAVMLKVVGDKTGYPVEMLELDMDMEADLGIDSIKRVEILGTVQDELSELPELNADELAELRTLRQVVEYMHRAAPHGVPPSHGAATTVDVAASQLSVVTGIDVQKITAVMLKVVGDKTGYPVEMLELDMDMEADLGIDSIKRVEILGTVQDELVELPELNADDLAELRTLREIVEYMQSRNPHGASSAKINSSSSATAAESAPVAQVLKAPVAKAPILNATAGLPSKGFLANEKVDELTPAMLQIVAEKTGYPVEMLELDMDMEADLGIDSIKRVEILGAINDAFPDLPEFNPDVMAEMRTLGEVAEAIKKSPSAAVPEYIGEKSPSSVGKIVKLPPADTLTLNIPQGSVCVITDDGTEVTANLASQLSGRGWQVTVLSFPTTVVAARAKLGAGINRVEMAQMSEKALQTALASITENAGNVRAFIHLNPIFMGTANGITYPGVCKALLLNAFLAAKHLKISLNESAASGRSVFFTVARIDGAFGYGEKNDSDITQGGLFGLTKTVNLEWPEVFCRALDIAPSFAADQVANAIVAELYDSRTDIAEIGYSTAGRVTLVAEATESYNLVPGNRVNSSSVFLVSGGAKGVTAKCVAKLAARYKCKFILLGRSEFTGLEPAWAKGATNETELKKLAMQELINKGEKPTPVKVQKFLRPLLSDREISSALAEIEIAGGIAEYVSADVTDMNGVRSKIAPAVERLGDVTGIIHGAGVLADKYIEQKTVADFDAVYSTKILGMEALFNCVDPDNLQVLVVFSSAAGFYGNVGQADYSVANDILNKTALRFKQQHPNCQVLSFNWGPWDGGMVTPELKRMFEERNVFVIPLDSGAELFVREVSAADNRAAQIMVGNDMRTTGIEAEGDTKVKKSVAR